MGKANIDSSTKRAILECLEHVEDMNYYPTIVNRIRTRVKKHQFPKMIHEQTFSMLLFCSREGNQRSVECAERALNKIFKTKWYIYGGPVRHGGEG